jgi:hypothetical protein
MLADPKSPILNLRFFCFVAVAFLMTKAQGQEVCAGCKFETGPQQTQGARRTPGPQAVVADPQLKTMISDADDVLPEFKADILLSLVESGKIADERLKKALVNRAFAAAEVVQPPYGEAPFGVMGVTPQGRKAIALSMTQLDRMSLQSRAVHDMQSISAPRARAMFGVMQFPVLEPLSCDDNWIYAPGPFYAALAEVADNDFVPSEIKQGKRLSFLLPYIGHLDSHAQVIPVAHLLTTAKLTDEELRQLSPTYADSLLAVPPDGLTFAVIAEDGGNYVKNVYGGRSLSDSMAGLISITRKSDVPAGSLLRSFRSYLVRNFNGPRCDPKKPGQDTKGKEPLPSAVASFNQAFDPLLKQNAITPITLSELPKANVSPTTVWSPPDPSYDGKQLTFAIQQLHTSRDQSMKDGQPDSSWWKELDDFLSRFYSWQQGSESEEDYSYEQADFYFSLLDIIPKSPERDKMIEKFVSFLEQHSYQSLGAAEWFIYPKTILMGFFARGSHDEIVNAFLNSRDPVLGLYARLERWQGHPSRPHWPAGT